MAVVTSSKSGPLSSSSSAFAPKTNERTAPNGVRAVGGSVVVNVRSAREGGRCCCSKRQVCAAVSCLEVPVEWRRRQGEEFFWNSYTKTPKSQDVLGKREVWRSKQENRKPFQWKEQNLLVRPTARLFYTSCDLDRKLVHLAPPGVSFIGIVVCVCVCGRSQLLRSIIRASSARGTNKFSKTAPTTPTREKDRELTSSQPTDQLEEEFVNCCRQKEKE